MTLNLSRVSHAARVGISVMSQVAATSVHCAQTGKPLVSRQRISAFSWCEGRTAPLVASTYFGLRARFLPPTRTDLNHTCTGACERACPADIQSRYCPHVALAPRRLLCLRTACGFGNEASSMPDIELATCTITTVAPSNVDLFISIPWHQGPNQQPSE